MRTSVIVAISIAGFGFALWLARGGDPPASAAAGNAQLPPPVAANAAPSALHAVPTSVTPAASAVAPVRKLDPKSERYANRMDDQIPERLYGMASHCYKGNLPRDQRLDVTYKVHVTDGAVSIGDVRVVESTLADPQLERCILGTLTSARWRDDELPNIAEDGDLFMRVEGFSSYLANAEDDDAPGGDTMN